MPNELTDAEAEMMEMAEQANDPDQSKRPTWDDARRAVGRRAAAAGEWAGAPVPVHWLRLVMEPKCPFKGVDGFSLTSGEEIDADEARYSSSVCFHPLDRIRNHWYCLRTDRDVWVVEDHSTGKVYCQKSRRWGRHAGRATKIIEVMMASEAWGLEAEAKAQEKLRGLLKEMQWHTYFTTGAFMETSQRSGVKYIFRRCRPTLAVVPSGDGDLRMLCGLCLHPLGYYAGTFAGVMVPTDCVIAHLLLMRACEHRYWKLANQHPVWELEAGL